MLEAPSLRLQSWDLAGGSSLPREPGKEVPRPSQAIRHGANQELLGLARPAARVPWWKRWLTSPVLEIYEGPDESLLFQVHRLFGLPPLWEVQDADGRVVARLRKGLIHDSFGRIMVQICPDSTGRGWQFVTLPGEVLGSLTRDEQGVMLAFSPAPEDNPLARMALLAVGLLWGEGP